MASHSMYGVKDFPAFVHKMITTATKACILLLRVPFADAIMARAAKEVFGQPYDSPNFQVAYSALLSMDIYPDVIMEADCSWPGWTHDSFEDALDDLTNRLDLKENSEHKPFLSDLLEKNITPKEGKIIWPWGNRLPGGICSLLPCLSRLKIPDHRIRGVQFQVQLLRQWIHCLHKP